jgi:hypothetical protein
MPITDAKPGEQLVAAKEQTGIIMNSKKTTAKKNNRDVSF